MEIGIVAVTSDSNKPISWNVLNLTAEIVVEDRKILRRISNLGMLNATTYNIPWSSNDLCHEINISNMVCSGPVLNEITLCVSN